MQKVMRKGLFVITFFVWIHSCMAEFVDVTGAYNGKSIYVHCGACRNYSGCTDSVVLNGKRILDSVFTRAVYELNLSTWLSLNQAFELKIYYTAPCKPKILAAGHAPNPNAFTFIMQPTVKSGVLTFTTRNETVPGGQMEIQQYVDGAWVSYRRLKLKGSKILNSYQEVLDLKKGKIRVVYQLKDCILYSKEIEF